MFEDVLPRYKIGCLAPLTIVDNSAYEFYSIAPRQTMAVTLPMGLAKFSADDVERILVPLYCYLDQLVERGVDVITHTGVPLPLIVGVEAHDRITEQIATYTGLPATSGILSVIRAVAHLGIGSVAVANKWSDSMNVTLGQFFARQGIDVVGTVTREMSPSQFQAVSSGDNMQLAYELGRSALERFPESDGLYIGGGAWLVAPVANRLESEFGKPVICQQPAGLWDALTMLDAWKPIPGRGRLLATP